MTGRYESVCELLRSSIPPRPGNQGKVPRSRRPSCRQAKQRLDEGLRSERQPARVASGAGIRRPSRRYAGLGVAAKPTPYGERRANGARRSSRWPSPRPPLQSFTKAISVTKTKPSDREARGSSASADCLGASSIASALGIKSRRDPALNANHSTIASAATCPKADISTWQRIGHFYLALTVSRGRFC